MITETGRQARQQGKEREKDVNMMTCDMITEHKRQKNWSRRARESEQEEERESNSESRGSLETEVDCLVFLSHFFWYRVCMCVRDEC